MYGEAPLENYPQQTLSRRFLVGREGIKTSSFLKFISICKKFLQGSMPFFELREKVGCSPLSLEEQIETECTQYDIRVIVKFRICAIPLTFPNLAYAATLNFWISSLGGLEYQQQKLCKIWE